MKDMIPKGTGNSRFLRSVSNFKAIYPTYDDFVNALVAGNLPVDFNGINEAGIQQVGTSLNKANLLTDETATALGLTNEDPTVDEAFGRLNQHLTDVEAKGAQIEVGSYVGTGTKGENNPCSITAPFEIKAVGIISVCDGNNAMLSINNAVGQFWLSALQLTTSYKSHCGLVHGDNDFSNSYAKKSADGKTVYWYNIRNAAVQLNYSGDIHYYIVIG